MEGAPIGKSSRHLIAALLAPAGPQHKVIAISLHLAHFPTLLLTLLSNEVFSKSAACMPPAPASVSLCLRLTDKHRAPSNYDFDPGAIESLESQLI